MENYLQTDEYFEYIKKNCGVKGYDFEEKTVHCARPDVDIILNYTAKLGINDTDKVLEIGCGVGRILYEIHNKYKIKPYGIDSAPKIIEGAQQRVSAICSELKISKAECIDYPEKMFNKVICWGVFDLTNQSDTLVEITRILEVGGLLLLTGKNSYYCIDDKEAYLAEIGSIKKNIPNHYTNISLLISLAKKLNLRLKEVQCFKMRGDLSINKPDIKTSAKLEASFYQPMSYEFDLPFYEYLFIFQKMSESIIGKEDVKPIAMKRSKTGNNIEHGIISG